MPYVFISHATQADGPFATRLANDLHARGVRYWKAPDCVNPGERWPEAIERALETCDTMVLVLTPAALQSRWVQTETDIAIEREHKGQMAFIPLDLKPCEPSLLVKNYQMISFRTDYNAGLKSLLRRLGVKMSQAKTAVATPQAGYDFYALLGKTTGQKYMQELFEKPAPDKKTEAQKPSSATPTEEQQTSPSIYEIISQQPGLLGAGKNQPKNAGGNPDKPSAASSPSPPAKPEKKPTGTEFWKSSYLFSQPYSNPLFAMSLDAAGQGDREKVAFNYRKAIEHYTRAIELYPALQKIWLKTDFLLGSIYHRRGECWMGVDFEKMMQQFNKTNIAGGIGKYYEPGVVSGLFGAGNLYLSSEEFKKAQQDFKKASELGYTPPKKGGTA